MDLKKTKPDRIPLNTPEEFRRAIERMESARLECTADISDPDEHGIRTASNLRFNALVLSAHPRDYPGDWAVHTLDIPSQEEE